MNSNVGTLLIQHHQSDLEKIKQLEEDNKQLNIQIQILNQKITNQKAHINMVNSAGQKRNQELNNIKNMYAQCQNELILSRNQSSVSSAVPLAEKAEIERLMKRQNEEHNSEMKNIRKTISNLKQEKENAERNYSSMWAKNTYIEGELANCRNSMMQLQQEHEKQIANIDKQHAAEKLEMETQWKIAVENVIALNNELKTRVDSERMEKLKDYNQLLRSSENRIEYLKEELEKKLVEIRRQQSQLRKANQENNELNDKYKMALLENHNLLKKLETLDSKSKEILADPTCLFCLCDMEGSAMQIQSLPKCTGCNRRYHRECLSKWLTNQPVCPVCKIDSSEIENIGPEENELQSFDDLRVTYRY